MANEGEPEQSSQTDREVNRPESQELEARVARLELELAALQQQIAGRGAARSAVAPVWTPPPPPPIPPRSQAGGPTPVGQRLNSEFWASGAKRQPSTPAPESIESFESRLGSQIFNRIAIVLLLIGTAYGMKLAVDRGLLGPAARVILGLVAGAGLVLWSERFRHKGFAAFSYSLKAVGSGVLYLSLWAAFQRFHLLPASAAMAMMILVTAWNAYMAWAQDSELLAAYALAGGFATPLLVSTGGNHEIFLFTYLLAIDLATIALVRLKTWPRLLLGTFPVTALFFIGWYAEFYAKDELGVTAFFITLFGMAFASVPIGRSEAATGQRFASLATVLNDILLPLANAALVALAFYSVLEDAGHHAWLPWLMIVLAAAYLGVMQLPQTRAASAVHLTLAVVFLTIAIPLKASGSWITVSWLVEGLALLWVATRLAPSGEEAADLGSALASRVLRPLAMASLALGFGGICVHSVLWNGVAELPLWSKGTTTALTGIAVFAAAAWLGLRKAEVSKAQKAETGGLDWESLAVYAFILIDLTAALLTMRELVASWDWPAAHPPFQTVDFATAVMGLAVFAGVIAVSLRIAGGRKDDNFWTSCAALSTIAFNLIAVLMGVREIEAIWGGSTITVDAGLQQALAISAFLMLYGAALLAVGFFRRSAFLRWQALVLLVFTICKTFLYDMRNLSQGYRVGSLLGLGALLMAISFAYQKDWLHLRDADTQPAGDSEAGK